MDICFQTFAVLFLLFAATSCAPVPCLWADVRSSSLELHQIAKRVSEEARNGSKAINNIPIKAEWIEAADKCDPETLKIEPEICLGKIISVSTSYNSILENISGYNSCAAFAEQLMPAINKLQEDMRACVKLSVHPATPQVSSDKTIARWKEEPECITTLERLFSFSIVTARVFAVGDPARHAAGLSHKCTRGAAE